MNTIARKLRGESLIYIFTLIISYASFSSISAQTENYHPMLVNGAVWDIGNVNGATTCGYNLPYSYRYEIGGDTLIDNKSYKYFYRYSLATGHNELCNPYWVEDSKVELYTGAFLREDTVEKKVYIYYNGYYYSTDPFEHKEYLLYDFSLNIGDTLKSEYNLGFKEGYPPILSEINYSTNENGKEIKTYSFANIGYGYSEQIGWNGGLFSSISLNVQEGYRSIYCEANNIVLLSNGWWTNNIEIKANNPDKLLEVKSINNKLSITSKYNNIQIYIYTLDGKCLYEKHLRRNETHYFNGTVNTPYIVSGTSVEHSFKYSEIFYLK